MKVINIYNQTFIQTDTNNATGNFTFQLAPYIIKSRFESKWKVTCVSIGVYRGTSVVSNTIVFAQGLCDAGSTLQLDTDLTQFYTLTTLGLLNVDTVQVGATQYAPSYWTCDNLSQTPFQVQLRNANDPLGALTISQPLSMSLQLRFEEYLE